MVSKSRKILTLLLTVLLIMSSMSALTVSAEATTISVDAGDKEVTSESNTATYTFTNEKETGWYKLSVKSEGASTNDVSGKLIFKVTATIGDASWTAGYVINTGKHYPEPGAFYLENGVEYTLDLSYDFSQAAATKETITGITFTKQEGTELSSEEDSVISHKASMMSSYRLNNREDALRSNSGTYNSASRTSDILPAGSGKAIFRVNAPATGMYDIYAIEGGRNANAKFNLYVDDTKVTSSASGGAAAVPTSAKGLTAFKDTKLGRAVIVAGSHNIKVEVTGSDLIYFSGLKLVPVNNEVKTVGATGATEVGFFGDMLMGVSDINYSAASYTTYPEEGLSFTSGGYVSSGGAIHYAAYPINVTEAGVYDISFIGGKYTVNVGIEVDGVAHSFTNYRTTTPQMTNGTKALPTGASNHTAAFKDYVCSIYLSEGIHQIKYNFSTSGYFYAWTIEADAPAATLSATEATVFPMMSYWKHATADGAIIPSSDRVATSSTLSGVWAGKESDGYVAFRTGYKLYYDVVSAQEQTYSLSTIVSGVNSAAMKITDYETGEVLYSGTAGGKTPAYYNTEEDAAGEITLKQGRTTLEITSTGGAVFFHALKFTPVIKNIVSAGSAEIMQGDGEETVSIPVNFEGKIDNLAALTVEIAYDEALSFTGYAAGNVVTGMTVPALGSKPVRLVWVDTTGEGLEVTAGTLATLQFSVPKATAKDYNFTVTVKRAAGSDEVDFAGTLLTANGKVTVKSTAPIVTFTNGTTAVSDVTEGTMTLSVDLNGNDKNLVIFAIYSDNGECELLEYSKKATIENGIATAVINDIEIDSSANYYAKALVWDDVSYSGFVNTLGK